MTALIEKLRPQTWDGLEGLEYTESGTETMKEVLMRLATTGHVRFILLHGPPGTGKTCAAYLFASTYLGVPYSDIIGSVQNRNGTGNFRQINASDERGINVVRTEIEDFMRTPSQIKGKAKILFLDEMDGTTKDFQDALRSKQEKYSGNCIVIGAVNNPYKLIDALISRARSIEFFAIPNNIIVSWVKTHSNGIIIKESVLQKVVESLNGDMRKIINQFLLPYKDKEVTQWTPFKTHANEIYSARNKYAKFLELNKTIPMNANRLIEELFIIHNREKLQLFAKAITLAKASPEIAFATLLNAL